MPYAGGLARYRALCDEVAAKDYEGFVMERCKGSSGDDDEQCSAQRDGRKGNRGNAKQPGPPFSWPALSTPPAQVPQRCFEVERPASLMFAAFCDTADCNSPTCCWSSAV